MMESRSSVLQSQYDVAVIEREKGADSIVLHRFA
jgi:hypothetical protein